MRDVNRIVPIIKAFKDNTEALIEFVGYDLKLTENNWADIKDYWLESPDLRFGQLLCCLRLIDNLETEDKVWNVEETEWIKNYANRRQ